jgi:uncharacterized membrane protein YgcG
MLLNFRDKTIAENTAYALAVIELLKSPRIFSAGMRNAATCEKKGGETMTIRLNRYVITALLGLASLTAGCAAKDVSVSQRGPIRGEATIEGDRTRTETEQKKKSSGSTSSSGSVSGSGSASGSGSVSGSGSSSER